MERKVTIYHTCHGSIIRQSEKAILFKVETIDGQMIGDEDEPARWFPKSQLNGEPVVGKGTTLDYIQVSEWILKKVELMT